MTANIPASVFYVLVLAFFVVVAIGVALAAYAARSMKRNEQRLAAAESSSESNVTA